MVHPNVQCHVTDRNRNLLFLVPGFICTDCRQDYQVGREATTTYGEPEGFVQKEGDIGVSTRGPYQIAYGVLIPKSGQVQNLLVPVCMSSSHIAFGSIRMEPVFMVLR